MIRISIADMSKIERMLAGFSSNSVERAISSAIKLTLKGGKNFVARKAAERYTAKQSSIKKTITTKVAGTVGIMKSISNRLPLMSFKHNPSKRPRKVSKGNPYLYSEVVRGQKRVHEHAFLGSVTSGIQAFERIGKSRYPIKMLFGPSAAEMIGKQQVSTVIMAKMQERLEINVMHEVNALLGGFRS